MKKLLLSLTALSLAFSITAQTDCITTTGWGDYFTTGGAAGPGSAPLNVIYWGEPTVYTQTRSGNGALELSVTQALNGWTPMGFDLGESTNYVDISANPTVSASVTNNGTEGIEVYFGFISGRTTGTSAKTASGNTLGEPFGGVVAAGATQTWTFDLAGAKKRVWAADAAACTALGGTLVGASSCMIDAGFDLAELSTGEFSINGAGASVNGAWAQPAITNHPVTIDYIKGGAVCTVSTNPATCSDGIKNQDETGIDCGGASCSPCNTGGTGGGTGNGKACIVTTDDGEAEATFYTNLEDVNHALYTGNVTCSFNRADIVGGMYGALETATLHGSQSKTSPAKYCGMCVEMTGAAGTATVQVVDECPDCYKHNTGDTDIDLSPAAFAAVVGSQSVGRSPMTWKEVSCPWSTNIHLITQGSNDWYAKVIVGNHVNRIASVDISNDAGSTWHSMTRLVDNGWEKGSFGPDFGRKAFKITDIYGSEIIITDINMGANPDAKIAGSEQFPACGLGTSTNEVETLDYVTVYPNPANSSVTFAGIEGATEIQIVNTVGRVVATQSLNGTTSEISLNISGLASGLYIAKMSNGSGVFTKTFVKN